MAASFSSQPVITGLLNPTSLQFGPDGRLYVSQQNGDILVYDIVQPTVGTWAATLHQTISLIRTIPNHNDDGSLNLAITDRQVTGILLSGTSQSPVLYVTSSDPRIANFTDANLDTNSGILSRLTWTGTSWTKVDLIRGLPRSEENHAPNGMALSADGTKLLVALGGNTNDGAPSSFFSNTSEYALAGAMLEVDLVALNGLPNQTHTYSPGVTSLYKYDLPTLNDPTVPNNGLIGNETNGGFDVGGPFGGNDGLNQAILPANAPMRIYATGLRNSFDVVRTQAGQIFTIDNGANTGLGGTPVIDANGNPTNQINNGGAGTLDTLARLIDGGFYGHANPIRANQSGSIISYNDANPPQSLAMLLNAAAAVPNGVQIAAGFVIDPSRFTGNAARLALEGKAGAGEPKLASFGSSTNGLMEYTGSAFGGMLAGDLITASFDGTIKHIDLAADGITVLGTSTIATPGGVPLDVTQGPDGSLWVAQIGSGQILVLTPTNGVGVTDPDIDGDGLSNVDDPFQADASNGSTTLLATNASLNWDFQFGAGKATPGPSGLFVGLTGHMTNGIRDFVAPVEEGGLDLNNVKIGTAAGGGLFVVEDVSNGTATHSDNGGEYLYQTGITVAPNVETFRIRWTAINPYPSLQGRHDGQQIGGFIGTGDQDNYLKLVAGPEAGANVHFVMESAGITVATQSFAATGLLTAPAGSSLIFDLVVNRAMSVATPSVTFAAPGGPVTVTGSTINLASSPVLQAINGQRTTQGHSTGLAVGLWSTNDGEGSQNTFQATFDDILITSTGPVETLIRAVNLGGGQFTASNGITYQADPGPTVAGAQSQLFGTTADIEGTTDDALYNSERWAPGGSFTYETPVANGTYRVQLHFAEIFGGITQAGQRVFDMALENTALPQLQNIDIFGQVGSNAPLVINQVVTVSDGSLSIQIGPGSSAPGNSENAKLNAFAIFANNQLLPSASLAIAATNATKNEGNAGSTAFTFTVTRSGNLSGQSSAQYTVAGGTTNPASGSDFLGGTLPTGTVNFLPGQTSQVITINVGGDVAIEASENFSVTLSAPSAGTTLATSVASGTILNDDGTTVPGPSLVRAVNLGGGQFTASTGVTYQADPGPTVGGAQSQVFGTTAAIGGTTDDPLYNTERWTPGGSYTYETPVANGTYQVQLHFAEIFSGITQAGQRVFDMALENTALPQLQNIDVFGQVGSNAPLVINQVVTVSDGSLSIQIGPGSSAPGNSENAKLNAFAIFTTDQPLPGASLAIAATSATKNEGNAGSTAFTFTVTRSGNLSGQSSAQYTVAGGTTNPASGSDFLGGTLPTGTVNFLPGQTSQVITINVGGDVAIEASENFSVTLSAPSAGTTLATSVASGTILNDDGTTVPGPSLVRAVNLGGGQFTASTGVTYQADPGPTVGGAQSQVFGTTAAIGGTTDDPLYNTERWTPGGSYTYETPVANGTYQVQLHFAEIFSGITQAGQRVFDMALENTALPQLQNIDVFGQVGSNAPLVINQVVTVSDGSLSIQIGPGSSAPGNSENAKLNAFAIFTTDQPLPGASLAIAATSATKNEGNAGSTAFTFTVTRSGNLSAQSSAQYIVAGGTTNPASGSDFLGGTFPTGTVTFLAGQTSQVITINVAGDVAVEASENFSVTLSAPSAGTTLATSVASGTILNDDGAPVNASASLAITPNSGLNVSTYAPPGYQLTNRGAVAITSFTIDLHNSLIEGLVFDPFGNFGDTTALDFTPAANNPVGATWTFGPAVVTEGGYKTLTVTLNGAGLAAGGTFSFTLDADPASIDGPAPGPNEAGSISGFEHLGAAVTVAFAGGTTQTAEVFTDGSAGGGRASLGSSLLPTVSLAVSNAAGTPLATSSVGAVLGAVLPGLNELAGAPGNDIIVTVTGTAGQLVRLSVAELGGLGLDLPLGSFEGNTILQNPVFINATIGAGGTVNVPIALPAVTASAILQTGSASGRFGITAALVDGTTGDATSLVSRTLVVRDTLQSAPSLIRAVNLGGGQFTASNGITYQADPGPTVGGAQSQVFGTTAAIGGTTDDPLYNTERWTPGGSYTYETPVANGTYQVQLHFAEIFSGITQAGQRVFDMALENTALPQLQNIDVFGQVGSNAPLVINQVVTVSDGSLSIQIGPGSSAPGNSENAKLNAFAIFANNQPLSSAPLAIVATSATENEGNAGSTTTMSEALSVPIDATAPSSSTPSATATVRAGTVTSMTEPSGTGTLLKDAEALPGTVIAVAADASTAARPSHLGSTASIANTAEATTGGAVEGGSNFVIVTALDALAAPARMEFLSPGGTGLDLTAPGLPSVGADGGQEQDVAGGGGVNPLADGSWADSLAWLASAGSTTALAGDDSLTAPLGPRSMAGGAGNDGSVSIRASILADLDRAGI